MGEFHMLPVKSSNIAAIGHDGSTLRVRFNNGSEFDYRDVPPATAQRLVTSRSIGSAFHDMIKGKFKAAKR